MASIEGVPQFTSDEALEIATRLFGLSGAYTVASLPSYDDQNWRIIPTTATPTSSSSSSSSSFVLKIANSGTNQDELDLQNQAMLHLSTRVDPTLGIFPTPVASIHGRHIETVHNEQGERSYSVRLLKFIEGRTMGSIEHHSRAMLDSLGRLLAATDIAFARFRHAEASRRDLLHWDLKHAAATTMYTPHVRNAEQRATVEGIFRKFEFEILPSMTSFRSSVIHGDANDLNILVPPSARNNSRSRWCHEIEPPQRVIGLIDFGDVVHSYTIFNLAIALAYVVQRKSDPLTAACHVIGAYHKMFPITDRELEVLFDLMLTRIAVSTTMSARHQAEVPSNAEYLSANESSGWRALNQLTRIHPRLAHYRFRAACGLEPHPDHEAVIRALDRLDRSLVHRVVDLDFRTARREQVCVFDLERGSSLASSIAVTTSTEEATAIFQREMQAHAAASSSSDFVVGIGRYDEERALYSTENYSTESGDARTRHIGIDIFMDAGSRVYAPLPGTIHSFLNNTDRLDYGPCVIVEHSLGDLRFFTLYGHLSVESLATLQIGQSIDRGQEIGRIGPFPENGDWPPHLHFQLVLDMLDRRGEFPGVAAKSQLPTWHSVCPNPNLLLGIPFEWLGTRGISNAATVPDSTIVALRWRHLCGSLSTSYQSTPSGPIQMARGFGSYLFDQHDNRYLDCVNNVAHVGHSHPTVVEAISKQSSLLNTNTRYLHRLLVQYAERLCATLPPSLSVCYFVCSGSEANDLALRLARSFTNKTHSIVVDGGYHGHTVATIDVSPYKFDGQGGSGTPPLTHKIAMPDTYRSTIHHSNDGADTEAAGIRYADQVREVIAKTYGNVGAFLCESVLSCGGQIVLPQGFLKHAYQLVREAGGVCVADEVQVGFGRVGSHFWGFELQGVEPDIVTLGKPMGNGHPIAAVVTRPEIARAFASGGMEYFNTFGGNPVSCAAAMAVLDVIEQERLQERSRVLGQLLLDGLQELATRHSLIGDVRGVGLFVGIELVEDRASKQPAAREASLVVEAARERRVLLSTDGPHHNVIKIKPPLSFERHDVEHLIRVLDESFCVVEADELD